MKFTMNQPCPTCPFLREGGIRLSPSRAVEIGFNMLQSSGTTFQCHETVVFGDDEDDAPTVLQTDKDQHCAGALIFAEKQGRATQMMQIAERLGLYDAKALMSNTAAVERVFDSLTEMRRTAI